jgi:hypothetical protein
VVLGACICRKLPGISEAPKLVEFRAAIKATSRKYCVVGQGKSSGVLGNIAKGSGKYTMGRWEELCAFLGGISEFLVATR